MKTSLNTLDWSSFNLISHDNIDGCAHLLVKIYQSHIEKLFPLTKCSTTRLKSQPRWFNEELRQMRNKLAGLKTIYNATKSEEDKNIYYKYRRYYKKNIEVTKKNAYSAYIVNSDNKIKASWNIVNIERNVANSGTNTKLTNNDFNDFFVTIADTIVNSIVDKGHEATEFLSNIQKPSCSFFLYPTTPQEVINAVKSLKNTSSLDIYGMNTAMLKETINIIAVPLSNLFNVCFNKGIFPDAFKIAKVTPIFKKGDMSLLDNYRPISIIPILGKILEILLKTRLVKYLEVNNILNTCQFGFRKNCSTIKAVSSVIDDIIEALEQCLYSSVTLCDLSKAFDCVSHEILIRKLEFYGIRGLPSTLFRSYLENRRQCVSLNNKNSDIKLIKHGVPQGSVLGPILFLIYINDLPSFLDVIKCTLFADDLTLINSSKNTKELEDQEVVAIKKSEQWFSANKLKLNKNKTQSLVISTDSTVTKGNSVKLLGITIDDGLKWDVHIDHLCKKLSSTIFVIRRLSKLINKDTLLSVYYGLFHSHLNYGVILWGNSSYSQRVFILQKRTIRILADAPLLEHCKPLFIKLKIMSLPNLYIYNSILETHSKRSQLQTYSDIHSYNTRYKGNLYIPKHRLSKSKNNSLDFNLYNKLPSDWKILNYTKFKTKIKSFLLSNCFYSVAEYLNTNIL